MADRVHTDRSPGRAKSNTRNGSRPKSRGRAANEHSDRPNSRPKQRVSVSAELGDALDEIEFRFLINLPESELQTPERLFFQIEQAHWFYEDFVVDEPGCKLKPMALKTFAMHLFNRSKLLHPLASSYEELFNDFKAYKGRIPTFGCIILNPTFDKILLVCNWKGTSWGFPKGKLN